MPRALLRVKRSGHLIRRRWIKPAAIMRHVSCKSAGAVLLSFSPSKNDHMLHHIKMAGAQTILCHNYVPPNTSLMDRSDIFLFKMFIKVGDNI